MFFFQRNDFVIPDCEAHDNPNFISIMCSQCFEKSNHDGHKLKVVKKPDVACGTCDCGDIFAFNPQGFCQDHQFKKANIDDKLQSYENPPPLCRNSLKRKINRILQRGIIKDRSRCGAPRTVRTEQFKKQLND